MDGAAPDGVTEVPPRDPNLCDVFLFSFALSPSYGIHTAREAHDWLLSMMREQEEFEVETDWDAQWPVPFWSETVRRVVAV